MARLLVGLDCGTQSVKATVICSQTGALITQSAVAHKVSRPRPGWAEQCSEQWGPAALQALRAAVKPLDSRERERIAALGVAFQRETFYLAETSGKALHPAILWLDTRAVEQVPTLAERVQRQPRGDESITEVHRITGKPLDVTSAAARMLWLAQHQPDVVTNAHSFYDVGAKLAEELTGRAATCICGIDTAGLVDISTRQWSQDIMSACGLSDVKMPALLEPGEQIGPITPGVAASTGLPAGLPVIAAGGDGQVFSLGSGAFPPGARSITLGTSVVAAVSSAHPKLALSHRTLVGTDTNSYLLEAVMQSGTTVMRWLEDNHHTSKGLPELEQAAAELPPGSDGLVSLPHLYGVRFPDSMPMARGCTLGWAPHHTDVHLYRSFLEGTALELRRIMLQLGGEHGDASGVIVGGGGAQSNLWLQIIANALGEDAWADGIGEDDEALPEACARGAAMLAGVGVGVYADVEEAWQQMGSPLSRQRRHFPPDEGGAAVYRRLYETVYEPLHQGVAPLWGALASFRR